MDDSQRSGSVDGASEGDDHIDEERQSVHKRRSIQHSEDHEEQHPKKRKSNAKKAVI